MARPAAKHTLLVPCTALAMLVFVIGHLYSASCNVRGAIAPPNAVMPSRDDQRSPLKSSRNLEDTQLRLLIVSDLHGQTRNVEALVRELSDHVFDFVLVAGDLLAWRGAELTNSSLIRRQGLPTILKVLRLLGKLVDGNARRVLWVPGNHDPLLLFEATSSMYAARKDRRMQTKLAKGLKLLKRRGRKLLKRVMRGNIHGRGFAMAPGLRVLGWGGAPPAVQRDSNGGTRVSWAGFPWSTEEDAADSIALLPKARQAQELLLTHCGPRGSGTTSIWRDMLGPKIRSGSKALLSYVQANASSVLAVVHGHTHVGGARGHVGFIPVFNGGPLALGEYAILSMRQSSEAARVSTAGDGPGSATVLLKDGREGVLVSKVAGTENVSDRFSGIWRIRLQGTGEIVRREFRNFSYKQDKFRKHELELKWRIESFEQRRLRGFLGQATMSCDPAGSPWCQQYL